MTPDGCRSQVGGWTLGTLGSCHGNEYGFRFGKNSKRVIVVQVRLTVIFVTNCRSRSTSMVRIFSRPSSLSFIT